MSLSASISTSLSISGSIKNSTESFENQNIEIQELIKNLPDEMTVKRDESNLEAVMEEKTNNVPQQEVKVQPKPVQPQQVNTKPALKVEQPAQQQPTPNVVLPQTPQAVAPVIPTEQVVKVAQPIPQQPVPQPLGN